MDKLQAEINIGMIGHVDHGKTSLVKALSGKWTDTHSEEIKRGISIRLGYADVSFYKCKKEKGSEQYCTTEKCPLCNAKTELIRKVSFVDAPGHETLMATMLSGAALMQGAVLVIAANEKCPQPRTEEHLMALSITGVKKIVVAQNKIDLISLEKAKENYKEIKEFLKTYGYEDSPVIPVSANKNINIDALIEAIEEHIPTPPIDSKKNPKMHVVRSFDINKPGSDPLKLKGGILGGSIESGELKLGDEIEISPGVSGKPVYTKIESLNSETNQLEKAMPGGLIAIGTKLDPSLTRNDRMKGQVIGLKGKLPKPTTQLLLEIHPLKRLINKKETQIKVNDTVILTVGTMTAIGTITGKKKELFEAILKNEVIVEPEQRIALSKREENMWGLAAYGVIK
ncbi:MAG: translation initiation factor IF-2 subunit gamma [Candidatus Diapherotrites archaeon]|nr:translation initiation factor IF-2 subunit gamma [Candidatus Diapherotrites archaeon]